MTLAIIDCETTGLKWFNNGIISLGAVDINSDDKFYEECRVSDDVEIDESSLEINGFKKEELKQKDKKSEGEVFKDFKNWCNYHNVNAISGFNVSFDIMFLYGVARRNNIDFSGFPNYYYDIKEIFERNVLMDISNQPIINDVCRRYNISVGFPPRVHVSLDKTLKFYNIDEDEPKPHIAINGALYATEIYFLIKYKTHYLERFANVSIPDYLSILNFDFGPPARIDHLVSSSENILKQQSL